MVWVYKYGLIVFFHVELENIYLIYRKITAPCWSCIPDDEDKNLNAPWFDYNMAQKAPVGK